MVMNQLSIRQGPELRFILEEHQPSFEQRVVECYFKVGNVASRYPIPHILDDMFEYTLLNEPEQFVAAFLGNKNGDLEFFNAETNQLSERQKWHFVKDAMDRYNMNIEPDYDDLFYEDIKTVLDFHRISFIDIWEPGKRKNGYFYKNLPNVQVW
jgi:hypothetical protein